MDLIVIRSSSSGTMRDLARNSWPSNNGETDDKPWDGIGYPILRQPKPTRITMNRFERAMLQESLVFVDMVAIGGCVFGQMRITKRMGPTEPSGATRPGGFVLGMALQVGPNITHLSSA